MLIKPWISGTFLFQKGLRDNVVPSVTRSSHSSFSGTFIFFSIQSSASLKFFSLPNWFWQAAKGYWTSPVSNFKHSLLEHFQSPFTFPPWAAGSTLLTLESHWQLTFLERKGTQSLNHKWRNNNESFLEGLNKFNTYNVNNNHIVIVNAKIIIVIRFKILSSIHFVQPKQFLKNVT